MIIKSPSYSCLEHYEQYLTLKNKSTYQLRWTARVIPFYTRGERNHLVECLEFIPYSLVFKEVYPNGGLGNALSLSQFNALQIEEPLNFKNNCHGFTFADGKYAISNYFVNFILNDEYE